MFATLVINALFMATASGVMFVVRSEPRWRRTAASPTAPVAEPVEPAVRQAG
jgi:hypothetical protein